MIALTLEDIMKEFDLPRLIGIYDRLDVSCAMLKESNVVFSSSNTSALRNLLTGIHDYCSTVNFGHACAKAYGLRLSLEKNPEEFTGLSFAVHLKGLKEDLNICMFSHRFVQVEGEVKKYLSSVSLFGEKVRDAFPNATSDIQNAGDCIAVDLNNAAVFHLMHVVEWGLRALAIDVGLSDVVMNRKVGKTAPLEYSDWERILDQLPEKIDAKIEPMPRGEKKQKAQEFYYSATSEIRGFKDAWRNHVMHTRNSYTRENALAVFSHVLRFMQGLAEYGLRAV